MKRTIFITFTAKSDSVKLEKYIKQLLQEHEMVIVPGFGAFISEYIPAVIDDTSGEIKPPSSKLIFNPKIKNNDGLLVGQVADATRCSHFEALQKIEKERDNIIYQLDKENKVELDELGILSYNAKKQVVLFSKEDANLSLENFGLESAHFEEQHEEHTTEAETLPDATEEKIVEEPLQKDDVSNEDSGPVDSATKYDLTSVTDEKEKSATNIIVEEPVFATAPKEKKKSKGGWILLLVILVPLMVVSVFIYMKQNKATEPAKEVLQQLDKTIVADSIFSEEVPLAPDSISPEIKDTTAVEDSSQELTMEMESGKFYLVGGSFKEQENAETYLQQLKSEGWEPFHMGKYGSFFIVGLGSYNTEADALKARDEYLVNSPGSGVWVLKR